MEQLKLQKYCISLTPLIKDFKVTKLALVPPIILAMAKHPVVEKFDLSSVNEILCGAAPMPAEQIKIACDRINPKGKIVFTQGIFWLTALNRILLSCRTFCFL